VRDLRLLLLSRVVSDGLDQPRELPHPLLRLDIERIELCDHRVELTGVPCFAVLAVLSFL
jgi:hypothetical protein